MKTEAYQANNMEFNPLYEKMKERFCQNGTIAEQIVMRSKATRRKKNSRPSTDYSVTDANSLPKAKETVAPRRFFTLRNINTACMLLLIAGTILFSGAAVGSIYEKNTAEAYTFTDSAVEERMILNEAIPGTTEDSSFCNELSFLL